MQNCVVQYLQNAKKFDDGIEIKCMRRALRNFSAIEYKLADPSEIEIIKNTGESICKRKLQS